MRSPYIGKVFAVLVIVAFLGWSRGPLDWCKARGTEVPVPQAYYR